MYSQPNSNHHGAAENTVRGSVVNNFRRETRR